MYKIDQLILFFIIFFIIFMIFSILVIIKGFNRRIFLISYLLSIAMYSGVGIAFEEKNHIYLFKYVIFTFISIFSVIIIFWIKDKKNTKPNFNYYDEFFDKNEKIFLFLTCIFFSTLLIHLFIPVLRIGELWNPKAPSLIDIFNRNQLSENNVILKISELLNIILQPMFLIYLYILKNKKKVLRIVIYILLWVYLDYLKVNYISRNTMLIFITFFIFVIFSDIRVKFKVSKKYMIALAVMFILLIPFLLWYENFRLGGTEVKKGFIYSIETLLFKEGDYPKYYSLINENLGRIIRIKDYFLWLIFLPIPGLIMPFKPTISINTIFSEAILGISKFSKGYYVLLPSILGEAFMIYGKYFYWVHSLIIGIVIANIFYINEKSKYLTFINLYFSIYIITIGRGGSQAYIPYLINSMISICILLYFIKVRRREIK